MTGAKRRATPRTAALALALALALVLAPLASGAGALAGEGAPGDLELLQEAYLGAAERAARSVVVVEVERDSTPAAEEDLPAYLRHADGPATGTVVEVEAADPSGGATAFIVTSAWQVESASVVRVILPNGKKVDARLLGSDARLDLALVRIDLAETASERALLEPIVDATPEGGLPRVGQLAIQLGRGLGASGARPTVNAGIVSAVDRFRGDAIQTDAALNAGNFGGPLVDLDGQLLGVAVRLSTRAGINSGVGFAIPAARIRAALADLKAGRSVARAVRPFLGVQGGKEHVDPPGVELAKVVDGSAAAAAGLKVGDIVRAMEGRPVVDFFGLTEEIQRRRPGEKVTLVVERDGWTREIEVVLGEREEETP